MKHATLKIKIKATDCFLYMDKMFIITIDNEIKYIDANKFYSKYLIKYENNITLLKSMFIDNKLINKYAIDKDEFFKSYYAEEFIRYGSEAIVINVDDDDLEIVEKLDKIYLLDFIVYAKKLLVTAKDGVYESNLNIQNGSVSSLKKIERIHDIKAKEILTKIGDVLLVSNNDGVFRGSLWKNYNTLSIESSPVIENINKINWIKEDVISLDIDNYNIYKNEVEQVKESIPGANFIIGENDPANRKIVNFASETLSVGSLISEINNNKDIAFVYNSNNFIFVVNFNGSVRAIKLNEKNNYVDKSFLLTDSLPISELGKPLSVHMVGNKAAVFEFYDKILMLRDGKITELLNEDVLQIKGFINSKNYQNLLLSISEDTINLTSMSII